ncbi:MAG: tyrosine-type recombinase/integrase [Desulfobacteraceae bacterium]|nr:MAG: tyrosine-type recombinase/integrase [Desulfobacteraceae bacterium]
MAILAECPQCHKKQSVKRKKCKCGLELNKTKKSKQVKYHLVYRVNGKQKWRSISSFNGPDGKPFDTCSFEDARDVEAQFRVSKKQGNLQIFDPIPETDWTLKQLVKWYNKEILPVKVVKRNLKAPDSIKISLSKFNEVFGSFKVIDVTHARIQKYIADRLTEGSAKSTINRIIVYAQEAVKHAVKNDKLPGKVLKMFDDYRLQKEPGEGERDRTLSFKEYLKLLDVSPPHLQATLVIGFNTGMRLGEIRKLKWSYINWEDKLIDLPKELTKEKKRKLVPVNHHVEGLLKILEKHAQTDFVITWERKGRQRPIMSMRGVLTSLTTACRKAGIPYGTKVENGFTFRDIRTTVKTNMLEAEVVKEYRDLILGHSFEGMDKFYLKPPVERLRSAMNTYTAWLDGEISKVLDKSLDKAKVELIANGITS